MSKQEELRFKVLNLLCEGHVIERWNMDENKWIASDIIALIVNDMINKLQSEIKG